MIDLYTCDTPNGRKVSILLEETGLDYTTHVVDIRSGEHKKPAFRKINPNMKIPTIVYQDGPAGTPIRVFESGAILQYLAEKSGRFMGNDAVTKVECQQWLSLVVTGLAPTFVQVYYWLQHAPNATTPEITEFGLQRYQDEMRRVVGVLDFRLREYEYLAKTYTIADMAAFPWIDRHEFFGFSLDDFVGVQNWYNRLSKRGAVQRGMNVPASTS